MKPIEVRVGVQASDAFIYAGHLFFVNRAGEICYVSMSSILHGAFEADSKWEKKLLRIALTRNDYYSNSQGEAMFGIDGVPDAFRSAWAKQAAHPLEVDVPEDKIARIRGPKELPTVLDMKAYAMRLYISTAKGVHEVRLNPDEDNYTLNPSNANKIFGGPGLALSAYAGEVLVSSGSDGLRHGAILGGESRTNIPDHAIQDASFRCGWTGFNLMNYIDQAHFDYLMNDTEIDDRRLVHPRTEKREARRIKKFASRVVKAETMDRTELLSENPILYAFNSGSSAFLYRSNGDLAITNIIDGRNQPHLSQRVRVVSMTKDKKVQRPVSHAVIPGGCVLEFFDKVQICQNGAVGMLQEGAMFSTRSYINSRRYRNLVTTVSEEWISIFSTYPVDFAEYHPRIIRDDDE